MENRKIDIDELEGKTLKSVVNNEGDILFESTEGEVFKMWHDQDCCESVYVDDIVGDLNDLIGSPILDAYESSSEDNPKSTYDESYEWTFYHISTVKGAVTIKWYGTSNGFYSTSVSFARIKP